MSEGIVYELKPVYVTENYANRRTTLGLETVHLLSK